MQRYKVRDYIPRGTTASVTRYKKNIFTGALYKEGTTTQVSVAVSFCLTRLLSEKSSILLEISNTVLVNLILSCIYLVAGSISIIQFLGNSLLICVFVMIINFREFRMSSIYLLTIVMILTSTFKVIKGLQYMQVRLYSLLTGIFVKHYLLLANIKSKVLVYATRNDTLIARAII